MATRPAPRKSTREERAFLADVRRAARNKNISMTDIYNYEQTKNEQFNQGLNNSRALEGLTMPTPQRVEFDISQARSLEGLTNKSSEGRGIADIVGRPGYVGSMYKMGDAYYPAGVGSLTDSLNSIASFVKDNPRLSAETTALGLAGTFGRLSGQGSSFADFLADNANTGGLGIRRGTVESMRGELSRPASAMDLVDAATYATPGAVAKVAGSAVKGVSFAAKAGKVASSLAVGSKPARVATGLASGAAGYAGYNEVKPEEAEAASLSKFVSLLENSGEAAARKYARRQAKAITSRHRRRVFDMAYGEGAPRPRGEGWYNDPEYAGLGLEQKVTTDQIYNDLMRWYRAAQKGSPIARELLDLPTSDYNALHFGHNKQALSKGGSLSEGKFIPGTTNLKQGARGQISFVKKYAENNNLTYEEAAKQLGFNLKS